MRIVGRVIAVDMKPIGTTRTDLVVLTLGSDSAAIEVYVNKANISDRVVKSSKKDAVAVSVSVTLNQIELWEGNCRLLYGGADIKVIDEETARDLGLPEATAWLGT